MQTSSEWRLALEEEIKKNYPCMGKWGRDMMSSMVVAMLQSELAVIPTSSGNIQQFSSILTEAQYLVDYVKRNYPKEYVEICARQYTRHLS